MTGLFCALSCLIGIVRKAGMPRFSTDYLQQVVFVEDFQTFTYFISVSMSKGGLFLNMPLIIMAVMNLAVDFKRMLDQNPNTPLLSVPAVKSYILQGSSHQIQDQARVLKNDLEIYAGFYTIIGIFVGFSSLMNVVFYWQMMRMRYMMSPGIQAAFAKLDYGIQGYLNHPYCPSLVRTAYSTVKRVMASMTDIQAQQQQVQNNGGGIMGALKNSCSIF